VRLKPWFVFLVHWSAKKLELIINRIRGAACASICVGISPWTACGGTASTAT
jgi:hypothetical protein